MLTCPQPLFHLAYSQTAKRIALGCFKRKRSRSRYKCLAYDPWGKRRFANGLQDKQDQIVPITTDRGYTEHEHLDEVGVIHMNGRIYDPLMGRFMSADPFIQAPFELQSHNRYAYVMNNPLGYTDPSGYISLRGFISYVAFGIGAEIPLVRQITTIGACVLGGPIACGAATAANVYASGGTPAQAAKAGVIAWGTAKAFEWAGTTGTGPGVTEKEAAKSLTRYAAHAGVGCVSSVAGGGQCGSGAAAAVLGKWVTNSTSNWGAGIAQGAAAVVAGGVGSVIAGGKFENGAKTAAFGYLFNYLSVSSRARSTVNAMRAKSSEFAAALDALEKSPINFSIDIGSDLSAASNGGIMRPSGGNWLIEINSAQVDRHQYVSEGGRWYPFSSDQVTAHEVGHALQVAKGAHNSDWLNGGRAATVFENKVMQQIYQYHIPRSESRHHDGRVNPYR